MQLVLHWIQLLAVTSLATMVFGQVNPVVSVRLLVSRSSINGSTLLVIGTGRCPIATVTQLTSTGSIIPTGSMQLQQTQDNATHVLGGSFIVFACAAGLTNIGGSLNMTCLATNSWSTPPNCVSSGSGGGSMTTTTTVATGGSTGGRCPLITNTLTIANGFISNANSLLIFSDTSSATATGKCDNGFTSIRFEIV